MKNVKFLNRPIVFEEPELILDSSAWLGHIPFAFWIVDALRPKSLVELGTHTGCSYAAFAQAVKTLKLDTACFAVDTWQGDLHTGVYGDEVLSDLAVFHDPRYASFSRLIRSTFDDALGHFPDRSIDLLHIDGYHTYEAITHDFNSWLPKVSDKGVMLFHDVNVRERDFGVWRFWDEVKTRYPSFTFLHSHGLGVLAVGKKLPPAVRWLVSQREESPDAVSEVRRFFGRLGGLVNEVGARRQLGSQVARLSNEVGASQIQIASLTTDSSTLRAHLAERDEQVRSVESDRQTLRDQLTQSQQVASGQEQRIKGLEGEVSAAHTAVSQRETELALARGELAQRSIQVQQIEAEMQSLREQVVQRQVEVAGRDERIKEMGDELAQLRADVALRAERVQALESAHQQMHDQLTQAHVVLSDRDQQIKGLDQEMTVVRTVVSERDTELAQARGELALLSTQVQQIEAEIQSLREQVAQRQTEVAGRDERIKGMEDELVQLRADIAQRTERMQALESAHQQMHDQLTQAHVLLSERDQQIQGLDQEMAVVRAAVFQRDTELAQARGELEQQITRVQQIEGQAQQLQDQLNQSQVLMATRGQQIEESEQALVAAQVLMSRRNTQLTALLQDLAQKDAELSIRKIEAQSTDILATALEEKEHDLLDLNTRLSAALEQLSTMEVAMYERGVTITRLTKTTEDREYRLREIEKRLADAQAELTTLRTSLRERDLQNSSTLATVAEKTKTLRLELERIADAEQQRAMVLGESVKRFLTAEEFAALPVDAMKENAEVEVGRAQVARQATSGNVISIGDYASVTDTADQPVTRRPLLVSSNASIGHSEAFGVQTELDRARAELTRSEANRAKVEAGSGALQQLLEEQKAEIEKLRCQTEDEKKRLAVLHERVRERDLDVGSLAQLATAGKGKIANLNLTITERDEQVTALNQAVVERDGQIAVLNQAVASLDGAVSQILASTSWGVTRPLRAIKLFLTSNGGSMDVPETSPKRFDAAWYLKINADVAMSGMDPYEHYKLVGQAEGRQPAPDPFLLRNIKRAQIIRTTLPIAVRRVGGIKLTTSKAWSVFKREGWDGLRRRVIFLHSQGAGSARHSLAFDRNHSAEWIRRYDMLTDEARATMHACNDAFVHKPLISVVMPTYNPKPEWLSKAIESVQNQIYPYWELCIADDASTDKAIRPILERYAQEDARIKVVFREQNGNISAASNSALAIATGEYVALLDHDDELAPDAFYWMVKEMCSHPEADVIYSDEDKISPDGSHTDTFFKPDWSPELMYNCMYMGHLTVYKKALLSQVGGFRSAYDFSQDYDLALRATEVAHTIRHIPRILYHWRQAEGSAAQEGGKPFARISNLAALQDAIDRRGLVARVIELPTANRVKMVGWQPKASIVIPTDSEVNLTACLDAIAEKTVYPSWEIIVVTNSKLADRMTQRYGHLPLAFCQYDKPYNFSDKCNEGARQATGEVVVFFNDDVRPLSSGWLEDLVELLAVPDVGAVAPKLLYEDQRIQHAGLVTGVRGLVGTAFHCRPENTTEHFNFAQSVRDVSAVSGACFAMRRLDFLAVDGFDAVNTPIMHSDVDLSFKVRERGLRCVYTPHATLLHIGHQSLSEFDKKLTKASQDKADIFLLKRWGSYLTYDPYFTDNMRGLLYHDSPEPVGMWGQNRPELVGNRPDVLLVTHDMSASGAPMVAYHVARHLLTSGAFPVVASPEDGPMRALFITIGIPVIIDPLLLTRHESVKKLARNFDCVFANTVAAWPIVYQLLEEAVPVMWYLHESHLIPELAEKNLLVAETLRKARHVYAGSERSVSFCQPFNQGCEILTYGVPDIYSGEHASVPSEAPMVFSVFGTIEPRKGQDIFLEAIRILGNRISGKAVFNLVGRTLDEGWVADLRQKADGLQSVSFRGAVEHAQYLELMGKSDVIVCPSRDDTLPLVTLDALSLGKTLICSDATGTSNFIMSGKDGLVVPSVNPEALAEAIEGLIEDPTRLALIGAEGRQTFLRHFVEDKFSQRIVDVVRAISRQVP